MKSRSCSCKFNKSNSNSNAKANHLPTRVLLSVNIVIKLEITVLCKLINALSAIKNPHNKKAKLNNYSLSIKFTEDFALLCSCTCYCVENRFSLLVCTCFQLFQNCLVDQVDNIGKTSNTAIFTMKVH